MASDDRPRSGPARGSGFNAGGNCVEVDSLVDGRVAVRNSGHPGAGVVFFTRAEMHAWIRGAQRRESPESRELDDVS